MDTIIAWCGFLGAWLLVAGPVYQAAIELSDQELERDDIQNQLADLERQSGAGALPKVSAWWWLFPPVLYLKHRRREAAVQEQLLTQLSPEAAVQVVEYLNKSVGWLLVGGGGFLIAAKETWELREHYEWPAWSFWVLAAFMAALCLTNAGRRMQRSQRLMEKHRKRS